MDATDFTAKEIKIDASPVFDDVVNLAEKEDIAAKVIKTLDDYSSRFVGQMDAWNNKENGIWGMADAAFRCSLNDSIVARESVFGANKPDGWNRARTASTQFYRQVTQMASNLYSVVTSKDTPFKYEPLSDNEVDGGEDQAKERAERMNLLAKWSMKRDNFSRKTIEFGTQVKKYGNIPVMVEWKRKTGVKKVQRPIYGDDPTTPIDYEIVDVETIIENRPVITILPIDSVKADCLIGNIQDQDCVFVDSVVGISCIIQGIKDGFYRKDLLKDIGKSQQWDGESGFPLSDTRKDNRAFTNNPSASGSGRYLKREVFVNLPIDEDGKWDELENEPVRYRVTTFGDDVSTAVVARIERNSEPDDSIPICMIHANPDDSDMLYHISNYEVIRSNLATETTLVRQVIDNNSLVCDQPIWEVRGEVAGNDREFRRGQRYIVDNPNSIGQFNIRDISQGTMQVLEYLKEDSNTANSIDKNMIGESFGARTSATEASAITGNSRRPNLVNIEYILDQYLGFIAERYKVGWEAYGMAKQVVQITDDEDNTVFIRPTDIAGEFDIVIDIVDDIKEDITAAQRMINYAQVVASTPMAQTVDWMEFNKVLSEKMMGTSKFVIEQNDADAEDVAQRNIALMLNAGEYPQMNPNMNLKKHLGIYKQERIRWKGYEDQNPNVEVLDSVIAQIEAQIQQPQAQAGAQQAAPATVGIAQGQPLQEALGGI